MRITRRTLSLVAWTALAAVLYFGFGLAVSGAFARLLGRLGVVERGDFLLAGDLATVGLGPLLLGLSWIYRRAAGAENAGSMAAWLAGWALVILGAAQALGRFSPELVMPMLVGLLGLWLIRLGLSLYRARPGPRP